MFILTLSKHINNVSIFSMLVFSQVPSLTNDTTSHDTIDDTLLTKQWDMNVLL